MATGKKKKGNQSKSKARVQDLAPKKDPKGAAESNVVKAEQDSALSAVRNLK